jgi:PHD/YefM family antitoxin component YafN of YafNO toxin-antitoxin module
MYSNAMSLKKYGLAMSKERMVVLPLKEYEDMTENLELLGNKALLEELRDREASVEKGNYTKWEDIKDEL